MDTLSSRRDLSDERDDVVLSCRAIIIVVVVVMRRRGFEDDDDDVNDDVFGRRRKSSGRSSESSTPFFFRKKEKAAAPSLLFLLVVVATVLGVVVVVRLASSSSSFSSFSSSPFVTRLNNNNDNDDNNNNRRVPGNKRKKEDVAPSSPSNARAQLSTLIGTTTSPTVTDFNTFDGFLELSEEDKKYFSRDFNSHEDGDNDDVNDETTMSVFLNQLERLKPIDFRLSISLKLSGFNKDGNFFAKVTKKDIEPFLESLKSDALSEGNVYKMHFHYHVMHAKKQVNSDIEKTIRENVRVEHEWSSTRKAKNVVDFRKVDRVIERDNVFGGDDDMTKEYKTEKDDVFSPYVIYALNPKRPKNPNNNKASVQYVYSFSDNDKSSSNSSQCFGTSSVSKDDASSSSSPYAWVDLTSGPNGFTKKRTKFTSDYARRVPPKVLGAHAKKENVPLLSASIAGFLGDASKTLFAPSIRREFLDEHFDSSSSSTGKETFMKKSKFKTDDAWISRVQIELVRISELPFNLQNEPDAKKIDAERRIEKYLQKALLPGRNIKVNEREVDFSECALCAQAIKNAMHYSGGNTNTNRRRGRKSSGIENRIRNSKRISGTSNSSSNSKGGEDFDEEDEEEFLVDESELLFWVEEYEEGIRKQLRLRDSDETTKVIPVFLFDLKITTRGKLGAFTGGRQAEIAKDNSFIVAVRNSRKHKIDIPSFKCFEDDPTQNAWVDSSDVLRALKASLMTNLFGIHVDIDRDDVDVSWAIGNDVFTPLSAAEGDSFSIIDSAKRTTIAVGMQKIRRFVAERLKIVRDMCREDDDDDNAFTAAFPHEPLRKTFLARSRVLKFKHDEAIKATTLREWERAASFVLSSIVDANAIVEVLEETIASHKVRLDCYGGSSRLTTSDDKTKKKSESRAPFLFFEAFVLGGFEAFFGTAVLVVAYVLVVEFIAFLRRRSRRLEMGERTSSPSSLLFALFRRGDGAGAGGGKFD